MAGYNPDVLADELARIKARKAALAGNNATSPVASRDYREGAGNFHDFAPKVMDTGKITSPFASQVNDAIGKVSSQATAQSGVEAQNRFNEQQMLAARASLAQAERDRVEASKQAIKQPKPLRFPSIIKPNQPGQGSLPGRDNSAVAPNIPVGGTPATDGSSYYTQTPPWLDINAGMTTFTAGGKSWILNSSVAGRFQNFINDLVATGYTIKTAGSYSDRNQANGSGQKSLHSYGLAIDINAFGAGNSFNPGNSGKHYTNLPKGVSALAAKYGLVWGGDWKNSKDYMHFSIPYKGLM